MCTWEKERKKKERERLYNGSLNPTKRKKLKQKKTSTDQIEC